MTEGANRISKAKNWADEIDDLYHDATQRRLQAVFFTRARVARAETADDRLPGALSIERGPSVGDPTQ